MSGTDLAQLQQQTLDACWRNPRPKPCRCCRLPNQIQMRSRPHRLLGQVIRSWDLGRGLKGLGRSHADRATDSSVGLSRQTTAPGSITPMQQSEDGVGRGGETPRQGSTPKGGPPTPRQQLPTAAAAASQPGIYPDAAAAAAEPGVDSGPAAASGGREAGAMQQQGAEAGQQDLDRGHLLLTGWSVGSGEQSIVRGSLRTPLPSPFSPEFQEDSSLSPTAAIPSTAEMAALPRGSLASPQAANGHLSVGTPTRPLMNGTGQASAEGSLPFLADQHSSTRSAKQLGLANGMHAPLDVSRPALLRVPGADGEPLPLRRSLDRPSHSALEPAADRGRPFDAPYPTHLRASSETGRSRHSLGDRGKAAMAAGSTSMLALPSQGSAGLLERQQGPRKLTRRDRQALRETFAVWRMYAVDSHTARFRRSLPPDRRGGHRYSPYKEVSGVGYLAALTSRGNAQERPQRVKKPHTGLSGMHCVSPEWQRSEAKVHATRFWCSLPPNKRGMHSRSGSVMAGLQ